MGSGIAEVAARAALDVVVVEVDAAAAEAGRARVEKSLGRAVRTGKLDEDGADAALARIGFGTDYAELADRELVIEAVVSEDALLASNTSSIPIMKLATATRRPEHVLGLHFFNPVPVMNLVEVVASLLTSQESITVAEDFVREVLHKKVVRAQDRAGFVVNALLVPYLLSAIRMLESGFATREHIDEGMVHGCAHPMGPLALTDLIGLDTTAAVAQSLYEEFKERTYAPPPLLLRMVEAGLLGRKSGRGFYEYGT
jgi:3-hydroxybutyryl-CoA dehydrogenase